MHPSSILCFENHKIFEIKIGQDISTASYLEWHKYLGKVLKEEFGLKQTLGYYESQLSGDKKIGRYYVIKVSQIFPEVHPEKKDDLPF